MEAVLFVDLSLCDFSRQLSAHIIIGGLTGGRRRCTILGNWCRRRTILIPIGLGVSVCRIFQRRQLSCFSSFFVCRFVEFIEQEEEHDCVHADKPHKCLGIVAVGEQQLECMDHDSYELDHLQRSQVLLPPKVFLELWSYRGEQVVSVHDNVDECVEKTKESAVAAWCKFDAEPDRHRHTTVMNDVQRRHLACFLTKNKENRIHELCEL